MKIRYSQLSPLAIAISMAIALTGCSDSKSVSGSEVPTSQQRPDLQQDYSYQLVFEDVSTGTPITDELQVVFSGDAVDAGLVVDVNNVSVKDKTLTTTIGAISVAADFDTTHTSFSVLVGNASLGWTQTGIQVSKDTSTAGNQILTIKLLNPKTTETINQKEDLGLAVVTQTLAAPTDGSITAAPVTLSTPEKVAKDEEGNTEDIGSATIALPAGVNAVDDEGKKITLTGEISATTVKYGNNSASSMAAFPGGFAPTVVNAAGETDADGAFITGGFAQFNLTDSTGKPIKKFDKPVTLTIDLPKTSVNPETGKQVAAGESYPVWSFDETSGQWKFETNGTISEKTPVDPDNFVVSFPSTHLSYWNLDFLSNTCTGKLTLNRSASDTRSLSVELTGAKGLRFFQTFYDVRDREQIFARYPSNQQVNVVVRDEKNVIIARSSTALNLCNGGTVNIPAPPVITRATLTVNVTESCPSGTNRRPSPTFVSFYDGRRWQSAYATATGRTAATAVFTNIANNTVGRVHTLNPSNSTYNVQNVTVVAPNTTVNVNFPTMKCQVVSGATGTGN